MYAQPLLWSKPFVRLRMTEPSLAERSDEIDLAVLAVPGDGRNEVARRRRLDGNDRRVFRLLRVGAQVASVVGGALLVAERLEPILQVLLELLIEFLGLQLERLFVGILAPANDALAQGEQELAQPLLTPLRLDELEDGVSKVVNESRIAEASIAFEIGHLRDDVGHGGVADRHQVGRTPIAGHVVGKTLVHPQRHAAADERLRE